MDTPPPLPPEEPEAPPIPKPPLGRAFFIILLSPIAIMAIAALTATVGGRNSDLQGFGMFVSMICLPIMLVCSIICAILVGQKRSGGMGVLAFVGIQVIYIAVAFGGCATVMTKMDFR